MEMFCYGSNQKFYDRASIVGAVLLPLTLLNIHALCHFNEHGLNKDFGVNTPWLFDTTTPLQFVWRCLTTVQIKNTTNMLCSRWRKHCIYVASPTLVWEVLLRLYYYCVFPRPCLNWGCRVVATYFVTISALWHWNSYGVNEDCGVENPWLPLQFVWRCLATLPLLLRDYIVAIRRNKTTFSLS